MTRTIPTRSRRNTYTQMAQWLILRWQKIDFDMNFFGGCVCQPKFELDASSMKRFSVSHFFFSLCENCCQESKFRQIENAHQKGRKTC